MRLDVMIVTAVFAIMTLFFVYKMNQVEADLRKHNTQISHISKRAGKLHVDMFRVKEQIGMNQFMGEQLVFRRLVPPHPALYKWRPFGYRRAP